MSTEQTPAKPLKRLYFETYLQLIRNSVGTGLFRNFYVTSEQDGVFDSLDDGENSCAFFVSGILTLVKKLKKGVHGTVAITIKDLRESGWQEVAGPPQAGDVIVWAPDASHLHIGFSVGNGRAISNTSSQKSPTEHDEHFGEAQRRIIHIFRMPDWNVS